jgi:hypothetical protein
MNERIQEVGATAANLTDTDCGEIEEVYQEAVDKYMAIALALAGGGAAGVAIGSNNNGSQRPNGSRRSGNAKIDQDSSDREGGNVFDPEGDE